LNGKELYRIWTPITSEQWGRFAKPALFVNIGEIPPEGNISIVPDIPQDVVMYHRNKTAIIVDLLGAASVENGLGLAKHGFVPVPLYNGIHETKIGGLEAVVDNTPIITALMTSHNVLQNLSLGITAPPAFLLDYNRDKEIILNDNTYDNRWSIDIDDMPSAEHMKTHGIERLIIWTAGEVSKDLAPIVDSYRDMDISIHKVVYKDSGTSSEKRITPSSALQENVKKFENARFGLMLITIMALINLFFMFIVWEQPLLWTAPTIMWLTYLWVPEFVGDIIAIAMATGYLALYLLSQRRRKLMVAALIFFGIETAILYIYALYYGIAAYTGYSSAYGFLVFGLPIFGLVWLVKGAMAWADLKDTSSGEYLVAFDHIDSTDGTYGRMGRRRRHFRGYRGYGGYGGSGFGGYRGGGYRGYGGGFGGGFGG